MATAKLFRLPIAFISSVHRKWAPMFAITVALICRAAGVSAEPVTVAFEAEIRTIFNGVPFDSGIDVASGDPITGKFTFDPAVSSNLETSYSKIQPYEFQLNVNGVDLSLREFMITALNDSPISDYPFANVVDGLELNGIGLSPMPPSIAPNISPSQSGLQIYLKGPDNVIESPIHPADNSVWNSLTYERAILVFLGDDDGGAIGFQATIQTFTVVPEPTSGALCLFIFAVMGRRRTRGTPRTQPGE